MCAQKPLFDNISLNARNQQISLVIILDLIVFY